MREGSFLAKKIAELGDNAEFEAAQEMLTGFVNEKAERAVADARRIIERIHHEGLFS